MLVKVRLLGPLREANQQPDICVGLPADCTLIQLCEVLVSRYPALRRYLSPGDQSSHFISIAVNDKLVDFDYPLNEGDTVYFFPAINGG